MRGRSRWQNLVKNKIKRLYLFMELMLIFLADFFPSETTDPNHAPIFRRFISAHETKYFHFDCWRQIIVPYPMKWLLFLDAPLNE